MECCVVRNRYATDKGPRDRNAHEVTDDVDFDALSLSIDNAVIVLQACRSPAAAGRLRELRKNIFSERSPSLLDERQSDTSPKLARQDQANVNRPASG